MQRRTFVTLLSATAVWPFAARPQQNAMSMIGFLHGESPDRFASFLRTFREGLNETGFVEGKNLVVEYRWADRENQRLPELASDLVHRGVSVIATPGSTPAAVAARKATTTIPIVIFTAGDPVAMGLVDSLNYPGGNVTGATSLGRELAPKRLELLRELMPEATAMALLVNPTNPTIAESTTKTAQAAAGTLGLQLHVLHAASERDFNGVFARLRDLQAKGLVIAVDSFFTARREQLAEMALSHSIAAIYQYPDFAAAGGVMSYGGTLEGYRLAGLYTGRILKGAKPADLPVQQATKTELVVSLKAAKALGLTVPRSLLARADEVIE